MIPRGPKNPFPHLFSDPTLPTPPPTMSTSAPAVSTGTSNSSLEALEGFALLCKSSSGIQCVMVLKQVLKHPQIFVFGELFDLPSIKQLESSPEHKQWFDLLKIFAYGTYMDYKKAQQTKSVPEMGPTEIMKLKQLTIVDMASTRRHLPYSFLQSSLDIPTLRALEDVIIECINLGLIEGHLNQKDAALEVTSAMGRDIGPKDVQTMISQLGDWLAASSQVISTLKEQVARVESEEATKRTEDLLDSERQKQVIHEIAQNKLTAPEGGERRGGPPSSSSEKAGGKRIGGKAGNAFGALFGRGGR